MRRTEITRRRTCADREGAALDLDEAGAAQGDAAADGERAGAGLGEGAGAIDLRRELEAGIVATEDEFAREVDLARAGDPMDGLGVAVQVELRPGGHGQQGCVGDGFIRAEPQQSGLDGGRTAVDVRSGQGQRACAGFRERSLALDHARHFRRGAAGAGRQDLPGVDLHDRTGGAGERTDRVRSRDAIARTGRNRDRRHVGECARDRQRTAEDRGRPRVGRIG